MFEANFAASCSPGIGDATTATNCNVVNTVDVISSATSILSDALDEALTVTSLSLDGWLVSFARMVEVRSGVEVRTKWRGVSWYGGYIVSLYHEMRHMMRLCSSTLAYDSVQH
jgi:hypothetical protein